MFKESFGITTRCGVTSLKEVRHSGEVHVVACVESGVNATDAAGLDVIELHFASDFVALGGCGVIANAQVNMGGNVDEVTCCSRIGFKTCIRW